MYHFYRSPTSPSLHPKLPIEDTTEDESLAVPQTPASLTKNRQLLREAKQAKTLIPCFELLCPLYSPQIQTYIFSKICSVFRLGIGGFNQSK